MQKPPRLLLIAPCLLLTCFSVAQSRELESGEATLEKFIASIRQGFESHDPDRIRSLNHASVAKEMVDMDIEVIRGAIDLAFDEYKIKRVALDEIPVEKPDAMPDGRELKFLFEPDGVIQLTAKKGKGESGVAFTFYFPYKKLDSRFYLCPTGLK